MASRRVRRVRISENARVDAVQPQPQTNAADASASANFSDAQLHSLQQMISSSISSLLQSSATPALPAITGNETPPPGKAEACGHVGVSTRDKIKRGEYVELSMLLPPNPGQQAEGSLAKRVRLSEDDGHLVLSATSGVSKRKLDNLAAWLEAWSVYCAVIFEANSDKASELIAYQLRIVQATRRYRWSAVLDYDMSFRQKAAYVSSLPWDKVDTDLYSRCFTGQAHSVCTLCKRSGHAATSCVLRQKDKSSTATSSPTCGLFNRGNCAYKPCKFRHACSSCGGDHPASSCKRQS